MADIDTFSPQNTSSPASSDFGDYSQFYSSAPYDYGEKADFGRTWLGQLLGYQEFAEREDFSRGEQQANNAFVRAMMQLDKEHSFSANEAQKSRDWQERMSNTAYQRAVADMKLAGINPVLAFQQGGASTPSGATASSGSASGSRGSYKNSNSGSDVIAGILRIISGLI